MNDNFIANIKTRKNRIINLRRLCIILIMFINVFFVFNIMKPILTNIYIQAALTVLQFGLEVLASINMGNILAYYSRLETLAVENSTAIDNVESLYDKYRADPSTDPNTDKYIKQIYNSLKTARLERYKTGIQTDGVLADVGAIRNHNIY